MSIVLLCLVAMPQHLFSQRAMQNSARQNGRVQYQLQARFQAGQAVIAGQQGLRWRNHTEQPVFWLALRGAVAAAEQHTPMQPGTAHFAVVDSLQIIERTEAPLRIESQQSGFFSGERVVWYGLAEPLQPGREIELRIHFHTPIAAGRADGIVVNRPGWHPQLLAVSTAGFSQKIEPAAAMPISAFADFEAELRAPRHFRIAASGEIAQIDSSDGSAKHIYTAKNIPGFAWAALDSYFESSAQIEGTAIRILHKMDDSQRYTNTAQMALEYMQAMYGEASEVPLTIVDGEPEAGGALPGLIFVPVGHGLMMENTRFFEKQIFRQIAAQYWSVRIAPQRAAQDWLLHGLADYSAMRMMDIFFGRRANLIDYLGLQLSDVEAHRLAYLKQVIREQESQYAHLFPGRAKNDGHLQAKAALGWATASHLIGPQYFEKSLQNYYQNWQGKAPSLRHLLDIFTETSGKNVDGFIQQLAEENPLSDFAVEALTTEQIDDSSAADLSADGAILAQPAASLDSLRYLTAVVVSKAGEVNFPVELEVIFADGARKRVEWDGRQRERQLVFRSVAPATAAVIDPDHTFLLDGNFANNSKTTKAQLGDEKLLARWLFMLQNLIILLTSFLA